MRKLNIYHRKDNRWEGRIPQREAGKRKKKVSVCTWKNQRSSGTENGKNL